ncbi:sulfatase family protein [Vallitalea sp.]|uniref:sulfatase family protein n=1 Tax=Vallitalea sp. TaxID=1882829 RepID=UPI0025CC434A|nr:sulfatase-like hydrolase/transferase [Vallitalea sp.]MCT4688825.1 sulfatase-like hydrolase/transferase [Vallitalea sp.]
MREKKNLVFIMTDQQRVDTIFMVQDGKEVTPNLNKLAKESINFNRAYSTCPLCVPARTAIATGKHPTSNGVVLNRGEVEPTDYKAIHQYLREDGYRVAHIGINHVRVKPHLTESVDFDVYIDEDSYKDYANSKGINPKRCKEDASEVTEDQNGTYVKKTYSNARVSQWQNDDMDHKDTYFCSKALDFLDTIDDDKPYALFLYLWAPHPPLVVPKSYYIKFNPDKIRLPENIGKTTLNESKSHEFNCPRQLAYTVDSDYWKEVWSAHLSLANYADNLIGKVIDKVNSINKDNTITLFTVDHGEHLGQHNMYQKMEMYEQAIHIPFMMKVPDVKPREVNEVVSHIDILPTVLDLLNIKHEKLDGNSLNALFNGGNLSTDRIAFSQYSGNRPIVSQIRRAVITDRYKYVYDVVGSPELYDLEKDPLEMENIADKEQVKEIVSDLHKKCKEYFVAHNDWVKY